MVEWWYNEKYKNQHNLIASYAREADKRSNLCLSREENEEGQRVFFLVRIDKFLRFYPDLPKKHYYEIITDKCALYFDLEYNRKKVFYRDENKAFVIFITMVKHFIVNHVPGFKDYLLRSIFYSNDFLIEVGGNIITKTDLEHLKQFKNEDDTSSQNSKYEHYANRLYAENDKDAEIFLRNSNFIDWSEYDRNRCFRIFDSSKKKDPERIMKFTPELSILPYKNPSKNEIFKFSFVSKTIRPKVISIPDINSKCTPPNKKISASLNNSTATVNKKLSDMEFVPNKLSSAQTKNFDDACKFITSKIELPNEFFNYSISKVQIVKGSIYCINVNEKYCLIKKKENKSNRVYFIFNVDTRIVKFKCFDCVNQTFIDYKI
ncbi:hypothetical protein TKK_0007175 [Trichogramma kaykai]